MTDQQPPVPPASEPTPPPGGGTPAAPTEPTPPPTGGTPAPTAADPAPAPAPPPPPAGTTLPAAATFGPPARQNKRTAVIVGAVVSATAIFGGGAALINMIGGDDGGDKPQVVAGGGGEGGGNPFGPPIDPTVGPAVPEVPVTVVVPGPTPAPTVPPPTTTVPEPAVPAVPDGARVDIGAGVSMVIAPGWEVLSHKDGILGVGTGEGEFWVVLHGSAPSASAVVEADLSQTAEYIQQIQVLDQRPLTPPSGANVDAFAAVFTGIYASPQGGTVPMEGLSFGYVRNDGLGIAVSQLNVHGSWENVADDTTAMMNSVDFGTGQQSIGG